MHDAHRLVSGRVAPLITWVAASILQDLRTEVAQDPSVKVAFMARDGHVLAAAIRGLDPELFDRHCTEIRMSRNVMEALWQDSPGGYLPLDEKTFRTYKGRVSAEAAAGAIHHTRDYLRRCGLPVDTPGTRVVLVDDGLRGGGGEVLHHVFGWDTFSHLTVAAVPPKHPRPDRVKGHLFHLGPDEWQGGTVEYLPDDPARTLLCDQALHVWETFISGPQNTVDHIGPDGPVSGELPLWPGTRVPKQWANTTALQAMRASVLLAAYAHASAYRGVPPDQVMREQREGRDRFVSDLRRIVRGDRSLDGTYTAMLWTTADRATAPTQSQHRTMTAIANSFTGLTAQLPASVRSERRIPSVTSPMAAFRDPGATCVTCPEPPTTRAPESRRGKGLELRQ
ncbi:hypothetical protein [Yinghuangia aomiensis]|uniref:hypothetical protein n=1 Tax=Yinghuangia aomiensis TaxID=676205 RepID=UPI0031F0F30C